MTAPEVDPDEAMRVAATLTAPMRNMLRGMAARPPGYLPRDRNGTTSALLSRGLAEYKRRESVGVTVISELGLAVAAVLCREELPDPDPDRAKARAAFVAQWSEAP